MKRPPKEISAFRFSRDTKLKLVELSALMDKSMTDVLILLIEDRHKAKVGHNHQPANNRAF